MASREEGRMEERKRIEDKIRELAENEEEERLCLELLDGAYRGLEEGSSKGALDEVKGRLDAVLKEMEEIAKKIGDRIG